MLDIAQQRNPHARSLVDRMLFFSVPMTDDFYFYALRMFLPPYQFLSFGSSVNPKHDRWK